MPTRRFFLPLLLCCAALSPALAELAETTADDLYVLRHREENQGTATSITPGEKKLLVSPDGHHKAEYFHAGCGAAIHEFRLYHERNGKWYTTSTESAQDYYTHRFYTRYAHVANISITDEAIELTIEDNDNGITFTETLPFAAETYRSDYRVDKMLRHHPLHEAAMRGNAAHLRALLPSGKVNPCLLDFNAKYAWEVAANEECRTLLQQAAGEPNRRRDIPATLRYLRGLNEDYAFESWDLKTLEKEQQAWEK